MTLLATWTRKEVELDAHDRVAFGDLGPLSAERGGSPESGPPQGGHRALAGAIAVAVAVLYTPVFGRHEYHGR
jgi:hypothetical protein